MEEEKTEENEDGEGLCQEGVKILSDVATSQEHLEPPELEEAKKNSPLEFLEEHVPPGTLISDCWPPELRKSMFLLL